MQILLSGYNIDTVVLDELKKRSPPRADVTPETLSAAYARISRHPQSVDELRAVARAEVEKARRSNRSIIFKMGHHSVAEHAVFNFDIIGISRRAIEELEKFRLCSYTEKSQRYIKLKDDFVIPEEVVRAGRRECFTNTIAAQNALYHDLYHKLKPYFFQQHPEMAEDPKHRSILNGWAKEDARYIVSLATEGQLGLTINARNLEFLIRRFASRNLDELRRLQQGMYELAKEVAPSIILFTEANAYDAETYPDLGRAAAALMGPSVQSVRPVVTLVEKSNAGDILLISALLHTVSGRSYGECRHAAEKMTLSDKTELVKTACRRMEFYDGTLREFEYPDLTFELLVSATCFAQLKRHRMATLTTQPYDPDLDVTVPPSVREIGAEDDFKRMIARTNDVYAQLRSNMEEAAEYVLTNAHRRRVLLKVNAREFYHISRLREDASAQWDIRCITAEMSRLAKDAMPLTHMLLGGKDGYPEVYKRIYGKSPKLFPPE